MKQIIFKIAKATEWREAVAKGHYSGSLDDVRDGFVHLSSKAQLRGTLEKHFRGERDLVLIAFEEGQLGSKLKWEASRGGDLFPHLYGDLSTSKAAWKRELTLGADGIPLVEDEWLQC